MGAQGGTNNAGLFMTMYLYLTGFRFLKFGYAASIGYALAVVILLPVSYTHLDVYKRQDYTGVVDLCQYACSLVSRNG